MCDKMQRFLCAAFSSCLRCSLGFFWAHHRIALRDSVELFANPLSEARDAVAVVRHAKPPEFATLSKTKWWMSLIATMSAMVTIYLTRINLRRPNGMCSIVKHCIVVSCFLRPIEAFNIVKICFAWNSRLRSNIVCSIVKHCIVVSSLLRPFNAFNIVKTSYVLQANPDLWGLLELSCVVANYKNFQRPVKLWKPCDPWEQIWKPSNKTFETWVLFKGLQVFSWGSLGFQRFLGLLQLLELSGMASNCKSAQRHWQHVKSWDPRHQTIETLKQNIGNLATLKDRWFLRFWFRISNFIFNDHSVF